MATRRRRRYLQGRRLLCLLTFILSPYTLSAQAESLTDVLFSPYANFTQCSDANTFNVSTVSRTYDIATNTYNLSIEAMTGISVTELNPELTGEDSNILFLIQGNNSRTTPSSILDRTHRNNVWLPHNP